MGNCIISLCLPTFGVVEWAIPAIKSIYKQNCDENLFEVVVTDNGNNVEFGKEVKKIQEKHSNLIYKKTNAYMFDNQLEALKLAKGEFLKFVNHRDIFEENALNQMIQFIQKNIDEKPGIYFSNGSICDQRLVYEYPSFDLYLRNLKRLISWTTGVGIWKSDYESLPKNFEYDQISPHSSILFSNKTKSKYIINDMVMSREIDINHKNKGKYDFFKAFAVEEVFIVQRLLMNGNITSDTFKIIKNDYKKMVSEWYFRFCIIKRPCSYDLSGFDNAMGVYFNKYDIKIRAMLYSFKAIWLLIKGRIKK